MENYNNNLFSYSHSWFHFDTPFSHSDTLFSHSDPERSEGEESLSLTMGFGLGLKGRDSSGHLLPRNDK
jgi:hypothetical protein